MLRKVLVVAALALVPAFAQAQFQPGDVEITFGGGGASNKGVTQGNFNLNGSVGYFLTKNLELALRQNIGYSHFAGTGEQWTGATRFAADWHFDIGKFQPYGGANIGYVYGSHGFTDTWEVAPEAGVKFFLNSTTFLYGQVEYEIFFRSGNGAAFNKGSFVYSLGLGVALR